MVDTTKVDGKLFKPSSTPPVQVLHTLLDLETALRPSIAEGLLHHVNPNMVCLYCLGGPQLDFPPAHDHQVMFQTLYLNI